PVPPLLRAELIVLSGIASVNGPFSRENKHKACGVSYNTPALKALTKLPTGIQLEIIEAQRVEKALAIARVILAVASGLAIWIDPTEPSRYYVFTYSVLVGYTLFSVILVLFPHFGSSHHATPALIQAIDILWV